MFPNSPDHVPNHRTEIFEAIQSGNVALVRQLAPQHVGERLPPGNSSPLHIAAQSGQLEIVKVLVEAGAELEYRDNLRHTPLVVSGDATVREYLCARGARPHPLLHHAAAQGNLELAEQALKLGAQVSAPNPADRPSLHIAAVNGQVEMIDWLLQRGADLHCKVFGRTALDEAFGSWASVATCPAANQDGAIKHLLSLGCALNEELLGRDSKKRLKLLRGELKGEVRPVKKSQPVVDPGPDANSTQRSLWELESALGFPLPDDYREYHLQVHEGAPRVSGNLAHRLYDLEFVKKMLGVFREYQFFPPDLIPIVSTGLGDDYFLGPTGVYFYSHEDAGGSPDYDTMKRKAKNFGEFLTKLRAQEAKYSARKERRGGPE
jgi:hypothetical protein